MANVPEPTWELGPYIDAYQGYIKVKRLQHIADTFPSMRIEALQMALRVLRQDTMDGPTYAKIGKMLLSTNGGATYDPTWAKEIEHKADAVTGKLESELKAYKNNLIKESIRLGQQDLANHQAHMGNLVDAIKSFIQNRDVCTAPEQVTATTLKIVELALISGQMSTAMTYINKLDVSKLQAEADKQKDHVARGLCELSKSNFKGALEHYTHVTAALGVHFNQVITMNDIANQTVIMALASASRSELSSLINRPTFRPILELEGHARDALECLYKSRYAQLFKTLELMRGDLLADLYLSPHVNALLAMIKERSLLQFVKAFKCVSLERMSRKFGLSIEEVEKLLEDLIMRGALQHARIDAVRGLLHVDIREAMSETLEQTLAMGKSHAEEYGRALVHLTIQRSGLEVVAQRGSSAGGREALVVGAEEHEFEAPSEPDSPMED